MIDRRSRYASTPVLELPDGHGGVTRVLDLRAVAPPRAVLAVVPTDTDRLDLLAWRYYRDPTRFWRICDASPEPDPFDVVVPGDPLAVPPDR
ncbi:MAG: hypothetical protein ACFCVF_16450 [Kineosporiaceae bacterium]